MSSEIFDESQPEVLMANNITGSTFNATESPYEGEQIEQSKVRRILNIGKRAIEGATLAFTLGPTNEIVRVAATGAVAATTHSPMLTAATLGGTTLAIESVAGVVAADMLDSEAGKKGIEWINNKAQKLGINTEAKFNPVTKAGISYIAGSGVATVVEHREDPSRTREQNMRYGLKNATALAGVLTLQGYVVAEGIANPNPVTVGGAVIGIGSALGIFKWAGSRIKRSK